MYGLGISVTTKYWPSMRALSESSKAVVSTHQALDLQGSVEPTYLFPEMGMFVNIWESDALTISSLVYSLLLLGNKYRMA